MRSSYWSSDVCSSDLRLPAQQRTAPTNCNKRRVNVHTMHSKCMIIEATVVFTCVSNDRSMLPSHKGAFFMQKCTDTHVTFLNLGSKISNRSQFTFCHMHEPVTIAGVDAIYYRL